MNLGCSSKITLLVIAVISVMFSAGGIQYSYADLGNNTIFVTDLGGGLFTIKVENFVDKLESVKMNGINAVSTSCPSGVSSVTMPEFFKFPVAVEIVDCGEPKVDAVFSVESDNTVICVSGTCLSEPVPFIGIEVNEKKVRFPTFFYCFDSTFLDIHVQGNLFFEVPDFNPGVKIKTPGGTNIIKIQYDTELDEIEMMKFYKNEIFLGMHDQFDGNTDVNLFGKVKSWTCENNGGDFPKNAKDVEIAVGHKRI